MNRPSVLVVGPGAIGGVLASYLAPALILGRNAAAERRIARSGLTLIDPQGRRKTVRGLSSARAARAQTCAAAFFCVKAPDLKPAIAAARPWIGPETAVVGLQNGIGHEKLLRRAFGARRTVIGISYIAADRRSPLIVAHNGGDLVMLAQAPGNRACLEAARRLLARAGLKTGVKKSEDLLLWSKAVFNSALNPLGALCAATSGELAADPALRELMLSALEEALQVAKKTRRRLYFSNPERLLVASCQAAPRQRNSMLQDFQAGRPLETRAILDPILAAGRRAGAATPLLARFKRILAKLEAARP